MYAKQLTFLAVLFVVALSALVISWRSRKQSGSIEAWGLGNRQFGTLVTWFLVGGDFYTAYTIVAIPSLVFASGAAGFFALPYTILVYPFVFVVMPRLWQVCKTHNLVTVPDFVQLRYGSPTLARLIALTSVMALLPYMALQYAGMQSALAHLLPESHRQESAALALFTAWFTVTTFTVWGGLHAPARIAFSKDVLIYMVVIAAAALVPRHFGGYDAIFRQAEQHFAAAGNASLLWKPPSHVAYATLALGSALAAFLYPHTATSVLASSSANSIRRNAFLLPAYTVLLGLLALLGVVAAAAGISPSSAKDVVPLLFERVFPSWFNGVGLAAIVVAAGVPASIMAISGANLLVRNVLPPASSARQGIMARAASVGMNIAAVMILLSVPVQYAVNFQLSGGVLILQTFPAVVCGLWGKSFHPFALLTGWLISTACALAMFFQGHFASALVTLHLGFWSGQIYIGVVALAVNLTTAGVLTFCIPTVRRKSSLLDMTRSRNGYESP